MFCMFVNKIIMFRETLQFWPIIVLCYRRQTIVRVISKMPPLLTCQISQIVVDFSSSVVIACVLN
jgi:hypothetical protein